MRLPMPRNAMLVIAAGLYLAFGAIAGYATVNAILMLWLGIDRYRRDQARIAFVVIAIAILVLIVNQFALFLVFIVVSLIIFYKRAKPPTAGGTYISKHELVLSMHRDESSWLLHSMSLWHAIGEVRMDMTLAVPEDRQLSIVLQGLVGNIDLIVPDDYGLEIEAAVLIGQIEFGQTKEGGMFQRLKWRSPNYEQHEIQLKLQLFYLVGDIKIRTI